MTFLLKESDNNVVDVYIYVDDTTGKAYQWDGNQYQELQQQQGKGKGQGQGQSNSKQNKNNQDQNKNQNSNNNSSAERSSSDNVQIGKPGSSSDQEARRERRQAELDKEGKKETDKEKQDRINRIKDKLSDEKMKKAIQQNNLRKKNIDQIKAQQNLRQYRGNDLERFEVSLYNFIKRAVGKERKKTYSRFNIPALAVGEIKAGKAKVRSRNVPKINVYFDHSASWDASKIEVGKQALGVLAEFERKRQVKINLYYFSQNVHGDPESALHEGGTEGQPIIDHITETNPDNVIVMTDSDIGGWGNGCKTSATVPGVVWLLWKGGRSQDLVDHLEGQVATEEYDLDNL